MFAVIKTGGKQYRVAADDLLKVEKITAGTGEIVEFTEVLMVGNGDGTEIGTPFVSGALVTAEIVEQGRAKKVITFKKRRRQNSRRTIGHRQFLTTLRISEILTGGAKPSKKAEAEPKVEAKADVKAEEKPKAAPKAEPKKEAKAEKAEPKAKAADIVDDITLIGGVGPALKKKLEGAGITSLKQIADLDAGAIAKLDEELKLGGRIERDEWVEQAKELLAGKPPRAKVDQKADKGE